MFKIPENMHIRALPDTNVKDLKEKKNDLLDKADTIIDKARIEKRELTEDEAAELAEIRDDVRRIIKTLKLDDDFREMADKQEEKSLETSEEKKDDAKEEKPQEQRAIEKQEEKAFEMFLRDAAMNERAGNNLTLGNNGAIIPTTIVNRIISKVYDVCPILERSTKYNVKGNLDIPYYDETNNAITVAFTDDFVELTANAGDFTSITLTGYLAGALSLIGRRLINNSQFDIVSFVVDKMAEHIARFIEDTLLNGKGDVTGLSDLSNTVTTASATAITADDLVALQSKVKDVFQTNAIWVMSPQTRTALRELKDGMGRYLLNDDMQATFGKTLLGKEVYVSDNMPNIGEGNTIIYYGDMKGLATKFSEDMEIQVLREKYATQHAVGVVGWLEFDSKVEDAQKIAKLVCANS